MAGISDEDISRVRDASDIVEVVGERVPLKRRGRDFWCCCPFHEEKTPSCKVDPSTQLFYCFGCHKGGDVFKFVQEINDVDFPDAVRFLAQRAHIELSETGKGGVSSSYKARLRDVCKASQEFFHLQLMRSPSPEAAAARSYLTSRNLGGEVPKKWQLGFAPGAGALVAHLRDAGFTNKEMIDANVAVERSGKVRDRFFNRIMFPIFDDSGACIAFGGRVMDASEPKYLNSQETPLFHKSRVLYGMDKAKASLTSTGEAIVVEGYTDVIALHEAGITNVVATLGTALTQQHIRLISRHASKKIVYLFDGDEAGQRAANRALEFIGESSTPESGRRRIDLVAATLPDNLDPADFVAQRGAQSLQEAVDNAMPLIAFGIERRLAAHNLDSAEGRSEAVVDALSVLAPIKDSLLAKEYAVQIASRLHVREDDVLSRLAALRAPQPYQTRAAGGQPQQREEETIQLTGAEVSRRKFEEDLLNVLAKSPKLASAHAADLAGIQWHVSVHCAIAEKLLEELAGNADATPAQLVGKITNLYPASARFFAQEVPSDVKPEDYAAFLVEELSIGDLEEAVATYKAQLDSASEIDEKSRELLFSTVSNLQKDLAARKLAHSKSYLQ